LNGLSSLKNLEELYVSHNAITDLSGLESNAKLRVLDFSNNQVTKLEHLSTLENLEELWASNNQLSNFDEVEKELKDKEKLQTVYFEGNPLQTKGPAVYRNKVRLAIPHIMQIDASKYSLPCSRLGSGCTDGCSVRENSLITVHGTSMAYDTMATIMVNGNGFKNLPLCLL
jgi:Leucine-rich repeat (LRR) protein